VGPNYKKPEINVSEGFASPDEAISLNEEAIVKWWEIFEDELLTKYIKALSHHNYDVLTATSNIAQARALKMMVASSFFPQIGADVNATRTYFSKNGPVFAGNDIQGADSAAGGLPFNLQAPQTQNLYNAVLDATWEIDIWGKIRRNVEAADAFIGQAIEERSNILISLTAELARNYMELRGYQKQKRLVLENIDLCEMEAKLIRRQYEVGYKSKIEDEAILAFLSSEKAKLPAIDAEIYKNIYMISVLTGVMPECLVDELKEFKELPLIPKEIARGVRSDLLRRRPDIRKAERSLAEATAEIGVAVANFFPSLMMIGDAGFQSLMLSNLFNMASKTWAFGGDIGLPIFKGGKLVGNLRAKRAKTEAALNQYHSVILSAFQEVESSITSFQNDLKTIEDRVAAKDHSGNILDLSKNRFDKGIISQLNVLQVARDYNLRKQEVLEIDVKTLVDTIFVYKALGGGWVDLIAENQNKN
jgi:NodT family efflux transporter outer membrane factor (OMF) lipoprotein